jgi:hypothetical protein
MSDITEMDFQEAFNLLDGIVRRDQAARVMRGILGAAVEARAELATVQAETQSIRDANEAVKASLASEARLEETTFSAAREANREVLARQQETIETNKGILADQAAKIADAERQHAEATARLNKRLQAEQVLA